MSLISRLCVSGEDQESLSGRPSSKDRYEEGQGEGEESLAIAEAS